jgi:hypothetical protein
MNPSTELNRFKAAAVLLLLLLLGVSRGFSDETPAPFTEYQVKALFLLNFTKYVDWPTNTFAATNTPITIGVYGKNDFGDDLQTAVAGRCVNGRSIVIRQLDGTNDLAGCQILFISPSEENRQGEILALVKALPVLTVGETDQFLQQGGAIHFLKKESKVRLEINLEAARLANLKISSKLLNVADLVKGKK